MTADWDALVGREDYGNSARLEENGYKRRTETLLAGLAYAVNLRW